MWNIEPSEILSKFIVSANNLKHFKCTGEHLIAHCEGGPANQSNIVAACWFCNSKRHQRKIAIGLKQYKNHVLKRLKKGKWNIGMISEA